MVAMGSSLSDQAWGRDSAVYRVSGVLTVIGGWFFTAMAAFTVSSVFATAIFFGKGPATVIILIGAVAIVLRTRLLHKSRESDEEALEVFNLRKIKDSKPAIAITFDQVGVFLNEVSSALEKSLDGLRTQDRLKVKGARETQRKIQRWSNMIAANTFKIFRLINWRDEDTTHRYDVTLSSLQEIAGSLRDITVRSHLHVSNHHSGLLPDQIEDLSTVCSKVCEIINRTARALRDQDCPNCEEIGEMCHGLRMLVGAYDQQQIKRIQENRSKTRLSILFYGLMWDYLKIAESTAQLRTVFREPTMIHPLGDSE